MRVVEATQCTVNSRPGVIADWLRIGGLTVTPSGVPGPSQNWTATYSVSEPPEFCDTKMSNSSVTRRPSGFREKSHTRGGLSKADPRLLGDIAVYGNGSMEGAWARIWTSEVPTPNTEWRNGRSGETCTPLTSLGRMLSGVK